MFKDIPLLTKTYWFINTISCESGLSTSLLYKSTLRRCSVKKGVLKKFANFIGKHLCWSLFLIKLLALGLQRY